MTYYVHAFCLHGEIPTIGTIFAWAGEHGLDLTPPPEGGSWTPEELASRDWYGVALWWRKDWTPLTVDIHPLDDDWPGPRVAALPPSPGRDQVLAQLARTRLDVAMRLPISKLEDDALWEAAWVLLDYFVERCGALVHIENGGFYQGDDLVLETRW